MPRVDTRAIREANIEWLGEFRTPKLALLTRGHSTTYNGHAIQLHLYSRGQGVGGTRVLGNQYIYTVSLVSKNLKYIAPHIILLCIYLTFM